MLTLLHPSQTVSCQLPRVCEFEKFHPLLVCGVETGSFPLWVPTNIEFGYGREETGGGVADEGIGEGKLLTYYPGGSVLAVVDGVDEVLQVSGSA
jgi:hypothetical protein